MKEATVQREMPFQEEGTVSADALRKKFNRGPGWLMEGEQRVSDGAQRLQPRTRSSDSIFIVRTSVSEAGKGQALIDSF